LVLFCSEFADIFHLEHFKNVLANDVQVVSSLPKYKRLSQVVTKSPLQIKRYKLKTGEL
jgi:hypothetical protein